MTSKAFGNVFKLGNILDPMDPAYGAKNDGTTDDATAYAAVVAAADPGDTIWIKGTPLLASQLTINKQVRLVFSGGGAATSNNEPASYFVKKSTMATAAVVITKEGVKWDGGGVIGQLGNTGDNLSIRAPHVRLDDAYFSKAGNDAVSIGVPGDATDANYWRAYNCRFRDNLRDGLHVESNTGGAANANAGVAEGCVADANGRDGIRDEASATNTYNNCNASGNAGWAMRTGISGTCSYPIIIGGDFEANTADGTHQINFGQNTVFATVMGLRPEFKILDESYTKASRPFNELTKRLDKFVELEIDWQPVLAGSTTAAKVVTSITRSGTTVTLNITGHGYAANECFAIEDTGTLFDGGYIVATVPGVDQITATVSADRASKLPVSVSGGNAYLGYTATTVGRVARKGNEVFVSAYMLASNVALDATVTGNARVRGLPWPAENVTNQYSRIGVTPALVVFPAGCSSVEGFVPPNGYYVDLVGAGNDLALQVIPVGATGLRITSTVMLAGHYRATPYTP